MGGTDQQVPSREPDLAVNVVVRDGEALGPVLLGLERAALDQLLVLLLELFLARGKILLLQIQLLFPLQVVHLHIPTAIGHAALQQAGHSSKSMPCVRDSR